MATFQVALAGAEGHEQLLAPGLHVVEVHAGWAGPCKPIQAALRAINFANSTERMLKFYTADAEKVPGFESHRGKCEPVFLMYKDGSLKETVTGVQLPQITQCISRLLGDMPAV